jgi:hypothetical protein
MNDIKAILADAKQVEKWVELVVNSLLINDYRTVYDPNTATKVAVIRHLLDENKALKEAVRNIEVALRKLDKYRDDLDGIVKAVL